MEFTIEERNNWEKHIRSICPWKYRPSPTTNYYLCKATKGICSVEECSPYIIGKEATAFYKFPGDK